MTLSKRKYHGLVKTGAKIPPTRILEQLITGDCLLDDLDHPLLSEKALKRQWKRSRDYVMSLVGQPVYSFPFSGRVATPWGRRPWCWWQFEAPEGRKMITGDASNICPMSPIWFGVPKLYTRIDHGCRFESQVDYLTRLGLLLPDEEA